MTVFNQAFFVKTLSKYMLIFVISENRFRESVTQSFLTSLQVECASNNYS